MNGFVVATVRSVSYNSGILGLKSPWASTRKYYSRMPGSEASCLAWKGIGGKGIGGPHPW